MHPQNNPILEIIRSSLEATPHFPKGKCMPTSKLIEDLTGYRALGGVFEDKNHKGRMAIWHAWNYVPEINSYLDITMDQFGTQYPRIAVMDIDTPTHHSTLEDIQWMQDNTLTSLLLYLDMKKTPGIEEYWRAVETIREKVNALSRNHQPR